MSKNKRLMRYKEHMIEVLPRSDLEKVLDNMDTEAIRSKLIELADTYEDSGTVVAYLDATNGAIQYKWRDRTTQSTYEEILAHIVVAIAPTPIPWDSMADEDYIQEDSEEWKEFMEFKEKTGECAESFIIEKYGSDELEKRRIPIKEYLAAHIYFHENIETQLDLMDEYVELTKSYYK